MIMQVFQGEGSMLLPGLNIAVFCQVGAKYFSGACVGGFFGVTEPIIYGVYLPKVRPFLIACLSAGVAGLISGILGLTAMQQGGQVVKNSYQENGTDYTLDNVLYFGDHHNDLSVFENHKYAIAMGNAIDEIKKLAFDITDHVNDVEFDVI
ncbi:hypothetical protein FQA39_LY12990 [Lamprigera yunnana]|nr:hypothetical protein FQA39_LY12990 [Lamprigera yunnana]